jgi:hypothetical protein
LGKKHTLNPKVDRRRSDEGTARETCICGRLTSPALSRNLITT